MEVPDRAVLRGALVQRYPWLGDVAVGPRSVEAGECDSCGAEARLVTTCGPGSEVFLGRRCATARGTAAWCGGHEEEARTALSWLGGLPAEADTVARLWWVATGEVQLDPRLITDACQRFGLPA